MEILMWPTTTLAPAAAHHRSLSLSLAHTRVQILISPSNLHPFHNISPLFSSPAEQMLAARVSLPLDYTNRLPAFVSLFFFSFSLRSIASFSASSPVKHFLHVPSYLLSDFAADRSFTLSCFALKPSLPLSKHSYLECLPTCAAACSLKTHLLFTTKCFLEYFPPPSWWILSSRSSCRHSSPLLFFFFFFQPLVSSWELFTAPSVRNTSISISTGLLLCFDIRYFCLASSPLALLFFSLQASHLGVIRLLAHCLSMYFKMFHAWLELAADTHIYKSL